MDDYSYRYAIYPRLRKTGPWQIVISFIPRKINGEWRWLVPIMRRWVEDYSYGEFTAYYEYNTAEF